MAILGSIWCYVTDNWVGVVTAIATFGLFLVALFQDTIRNCLHHPKLEVSITPKPPDCHQIGIVMRPNMSTMPPTSGAPPGTQGIDFLSLYLRLRVKNIGNIAAKDVEVFALSLTREAADGNYRPVETFLPMNLKWSHLHEVFYPQISPGMYRHCDLAHIYDLTGKQTLQLQQPTEYLETENPNDTYLSFDLIVRPNNKGHLVGPGRYQIKIQVAASNCKPIEKTFEINLQGRWYDDEDEMLERGVGV